jgi:MMP 1-O-methyltransferase
MPRTELYKQIPSEWSDFFPIYDEAVRTAPSGSILIEVGSFWGKSAVYLAEAAKLADKNLKVYCIDPWSARPDNNPGLFDHEHGKLGHIEPQVHAEHHNSMFETFAYFLERTGLSPDPLRVMRMESLEAAELFNEAIPIHFIFLDGDHEYDYVIRELRAWAPLLSRGGFIAGHDWTDEFHGVKEAVTEYVEHDLEGGARVSVECGRSWVIRPLMSTGWEWVCRWCGHTNRGTDSCYLCEKCGIAR